jgi:hypothetical protein
MNQAENHHFSGPVTVFHERRLPELATPVGYAALIDAYRLPAAASSFIRATPLSRRSCTARSRWISGSGTMTAVCSNLSDISRIYPAICILRFSA